MTGNELVKLLKQNGFALNRVSGSHHVLENGSIKVSVPVHGKRDLLNGLLKQGGLK
jgi:predicted RNA binding protein YcfA (HicA-like mRNA interferase family)